MRYLQYENDWHDPNLASALDELSLWAARFGILLLDAIEFRQNLRVLDLGCGQGFPLFELAQRLGSTCHVTGMDVWAQALERARFKREVYSIPNVSLVQADAARAPFLEGAFDLIVSNLGINNWEDPRGVLAQCFRVLKPKATIMLTTNLTGHYREFYNVFYQVLSEGYPPAYLERLRANEAHRGSQESIINLLEGAGFQIVRVIADRFELRFQDGTAMLHHALTRFGFLDGWRHVVEPEDETLVFQALEHRLNAIAAEQGVLRMSVPMLLVEGEKASP